MEKFIIEPLTHEHRVLDSIVEDFSDTTNVDKIKACQKALHNHLDRVISSDKINGTNLASSYKKLADEINKRLLFLNNN